TGALDVLAQQLVAETAASGGEDCDSLFELFRGAMPYRDLTREAFDAVVRMLAEGYSFARGRNQAYLHFDAVNQKLSPRRQARLVAVTCGGAIPDNADYDVVAEPHGELVGSVNEDFAIESLPGNIFQLGNTSWRVLRVESSALRVEDAAGEPPNMPFWLGEAPARSDEFSMAVSRLRAAAGAFCTSHSAPLPEISRYLIEIPGVGVVGAAQAAEYIYMGYVALGAMPTQETLVLERFFDESGGMQLVLHAPFGSRINRAWGLALRKRFCRTFNFELQAAAIEDAIVISLGEIHSFPLEDVWRFLNSSSVRDVLIQALLDAPMFAVRWRWVAACALALQRFKNGKKNPPRLMRMQAEDLVASVFPDQLACAENLSGRREVPDHPLVNQTIQDCLNEAMDINGLEDLIKQIEAGRKTLLVRDLTEPSPFALQVLNANPYAFLDDAPLEERRTQAVKSRRWLDSETVKNLGRLDQAAIDRVRDEIRPQPRDHEECHEALEALGFMLEKEQEKYSKNNPINRFIDLLYKEGRVVRFDAPQRGWCVTERAHELGALWPGVGFAATAAARAYDAGPVAAFELCLQSLVRARMEVSGPVRATELAEVFAVTPEAVSLALAALENQGIVFRGEYEPGCGEQWCDRRLLARIHRYTINRLRREIEPVPGAVFMRFLFDWQHLTVTTRLQSSDGLMALLEQMSGFEAPVAAWEKHILGPRMRVYQGLMLDELVRSGRATWLRLRPKQSSVARMSGTMRTTPISLMPRVDRMMWLSSLKNPDSEGHNLSAAAAAVRHSMTQLGPAFFDDIASYSKLLPAQCEQGLDELAALGALSCDSFAGLRALIRPNGKSAVRGRARTASLIDAGRWELVRRPLEPARPEFDESEVEAVARVLLRRYGVVFRAMLANEPALPPWRHLLWAYRRLEASGEVRGGRFVAGHSGEQFALSEAVSALREVRKRDDQKQVVAVNASDPLNLVGVVVPGVRIPAKSTNQLVFLDGEYVANRNGNAFNFAKTLDTATATRVRTALIEPKAGGRRRGSRPQWR
ncbi:MAG: DNA glycosylase AlkZ-like family protein, partial [Gammaproteobacteria bacterium]